MIRTPSLFGLQRIISRITGAGTLIFAGAITTDKTQTWQDKTGTIALTSDLAGGPQTFRNLLRNGRLQIDQRVTSATPITVATGTYGPDGWIAEKTVAGQVMTIGQVPAVNTPMTGSNYALKLNITTGAALAVGTDRVLIQQKIEGNIFSRCNMGSAQAATVYYSFWAESTTTGTFSVSLSTSIAGYSYVVNHTMAATNTRTLFQGSFTPTTNGTWTTDNSASADFTICLGGGATYQCPANTWSPGKFYATSSTTNFASAVNSFQVSDLYVGTEPISGVTTDYPHVPFDVELLRCKRYFRNVTNACMKGTAFSATVFARCGVQFEQPMRTLPTVTLVGSTGSWAAGANSGTITALGTGYSDAQRLEFDITAATGTTTIGFAVNVFSATLYVSAEL